MTERGKQIRRDTLTLGLPNGIYHYGGSFSVVEILIVLYDFMAGADDRVIMSKGHCWIPQVVILKERGLEPGFGPRLDNPAVNCLVGHPFLDPKNGIYATTGSLGHGMPIGVGLAIGKKLLGQPGRVYVIVGDGECQEGTFWESLQLAMKFRLANLCVIVDRNRIQGSGRVDDVLPMPNLAQIAGAAGWVTSRHRGHDLDDLLMGLRYLEIESQQQQRPGLLVAETIKGAGVSFMEDDPSWHARYPSKEEQALIFEELKPAEEVPAQ